MLSAMAYTVMKLHKRYLMPMESLDEFCNYLQIKLEKDFCFDDDTVISTMERSMEELKRAKLDYPGAPLPHELPRYPFGTFQEPTFTSKVLLECHPLALYLLCLLALDAIDAIFMSYPLNIDKNSYTCVFFIPSDYAVYKSITI